MPDGGDHGRSVQTTERGSRCGFAAFAKVKGRKRHILAATLGFPFASRGAPAAVADRLAGRRRLVGGLKLAFADLKTIIADAGHESPELARHMQRHDGYELQIVRPRQRAFKITGLTRIVERSLAWPGRHRRFANDDEYRVRTSQTMAGAAAIRLTPNRPAPG